MARMLAVRNGRDPPAAESRIPDHSRGTRQIKVVCDLERLFPERHQRVIHRVVPAPLSWHRKT
jgi:hypothetical protein